MPALASINWRGVSENTSCQVPAAAQTTSNCNRSGSTKTREIGVVSERRHATDGEAGGGADDVGVHPTAPQATCRRSELRLIELVGAAHIGQHHLAVDTEDQALDDLPDVATDRLRRVDRRLRPLREADRFDRETDRCTRFDHVHHVAVQHLLGITHGQRR